jgi:FAD synthase
MDFVVLFPGNPGTLGVPAEVFTHRILLAVMKTQLVLVRGCAEASGPLIDGAGVDVDAIAVSPFGGNSWVSTTRIRDRPGVGDIESVNHLLGRPYTLTATVRDAEGGWLHASVPSNRALPAAGVYRVAVEFKSGSVPELVEAVASVAPRRSGAPSHLSIPLDRPVDPPVDYGRLRVGFLARCPSGEINEPTDPSSEAIPTVSIRYDVR